uniref:GPS domain-containing protein n=1 Tax=Rodentolepis nana TaxID=102285 RepID=A0A0R3U0V4_RODNA
LQQIWDKWAHLTWDSVNSPGPQAIHYLVNYTENGAQWTQLETTECVAVIPFHNGTLEAIVRATYTPCEGSETIHGNISKSVAIRNAYKGYCSCKTWIIFAAIPGAIILMENAILATKALRRRFHKP